MPWFRNRQSEVVPAHTIRRSARAKHVRLKVTVQDGLCVVVPRHFDVAKVPALLKRQERWITNALARTQQMSQHLEQQPLPFLPERLELSALGEEWAIHYRESTRARLVLQEGSRELVFSGKSFPRAAVIAKLKGWLRGRVASALAPLAFEFARQKGMTIRKVLPRSQRTRWASCSAKGTLSLNTKLLFLPPDHMRYVLIHELCHTVHMNHSRSFWRLVETHEAHFRLLKRQLRDAWKNLPPWLTAH
ncbi:MAG: SprT family zinc-dependent metalloprotease [Kiritimatiellaeota bacterium]|nr:SprT family zinc-dependent metalloprotease [Kiritimatiellota bacterium]